MLSRSVRLKVTRSGKSMGIPSSASFNNRKSRSLGDSLVAPISKSPSRSCLAGRSDALPHLRPTIPRTACCNFAGS